MAEQFPINKRHPIEQKQFFRHRAKLLETLETAQQFHLSAVGLAQSANTRKIGVAQKIVDKRVD